MVDNLKQAPSSSVAEVFIGQLEPLLGRFTSRQAMVLFGRQVGRSVEELTSEDMEEIIRFLRPMLRTLVGKRTAAAVLDKIREVLEAGPM